MTYFQDLIDNYNGFFKETDKYNGETYLRKKGKKLLPFKVMQGVKVKQIPQLTNGLQAILLGRGQKGAIALIYVYKNKPPTWK